MAVQTDDAVGGEVRAVLGDGVEQPGAAGARGPGEEHGAAAGEQPDQLLALAFTGQQRQHGLRGSRRDGRLRGAVGPGALGLRQLRRAGGPLGGRAGLYLAAVDGVDGEQEVTGDELHRAGERGRSEVGCEGIPGRALARRVPVAVATVLPGSRVVRVHRS